MVVANIAVWLSNIVRQSYPHNRLWRPIGLFDVKDPPLSRKSAHRCVSPRHQLHFTPKKHYFSASDTYFC
jgi:hypothetical protein